ncbi:AfsR/SARP family transcriptional regulator [Kutzneria chonburiensis]|uniref:BTAD domain-containing putative transcriptional regulator n=1 Tax=Kutzneria chonburiensis TaxID=1483604 RepID=A0ABV6MPI5_9PSEU|nr:BTAD domain-containing putative transcriptional regulator [Kutzneria chonburiensis]
MSSGEKPAGEGAAVEFRVLGEVAVHVAGRLVEVGYAQLRTTLAVLVVEANQTVSIDQLVDRVWGARQLPRRPRAAVQHSLTLVRKALAAAGGVTITWRSSGYRLSVDPAAVDLHRFRQLVADARGTGDDDAAAALFEQALRLWRGVPFSGLDNPWVTDLRSSLGVEWRAARLDLTDIQLRRGQHAALLAGLAEQTGQHPLDERLAGQYLLALYRSGRQAQALEHYHRLRHLLADELGTDPGPSLQRLHQQIVTADSALTAPAAVATAAIRSRPVPRQLPAPPRVFTGRTTELAYLDTALHEHADSAGTVVISTLTGAGGIGKTALALHWAHRHLRGFPDGQLFVDLHGFSPVDTPLTPAVAIRGFLDALGVDPAGIPPDPQAQVGLYRSLVADKRLLIVLDNAADAAQIDSLLPGSPTCTVIVTSRRHLTSVAVRHGAHQLKLDVLADNEARQLLTSRLGVDRMRAEPVAAGELLARCAGFPLALAIVAARIHAAPDQSLSILAADLRDAARLGAFEDEDDPAASLRAVLSWSLRALTEEQVHLFGLLGIAPGPDIALPAAASLLGLAVNQAERALRGLNQANLLDRGPDGRYSMHDLIRAHAADTAHQRVSKEARTAALRRVVDFYLHTAFGAEQLLLPLLPPIGLRQPADGCHPLVLTDQAAALAWFTAEYPTLHAVQDLAAAQEWAADVWRLAWILTTFLYRHGRFQDALAIWRAGEAAARQLDDPVVRTRTHQLLGAIFAELGRHAEAMEHLNLAVRSGDTPAQAYTHHTLGWLSSLRGDHRQALGHATEALRRYRAAGMPAGEVRELTVMSWYYALLGDHARAQVQSEEALAMARRHHCVEDEGLSRSVLGYVAFHTGRFSAALGHFEQADTLLHDVGNTYYRAIVLDYLGRTHLALDDIAASHHTWTLALQLYQEQHRTAEADDLRKRLGMLTWQRVGAAAR